MFSVGFCCGTMRLKQGHTYFKPQPPEYKDPHRDSRCIRWGLLISHFTLPTYKRLHQNAKGFASGMQIITVSLHARKEEHSDIAIVHMKMMHSWLLTLISRRLFLWCLILTQIWPVKRGGGESKNSKLLRLIALYRDEETNVSSNVCFWWCSCKEENLEALQISVESTAAGCSVARKGH